MAIPFFLDNSSDDNEMLPRRGFTNDNDLSTSEDSDTLMASRGGGKDDDGGALFRRLGGGSW